jgi:uroporphyrin-III C-methyltransferase
MGGGNPAHSSKNSACSGGEMKTMAMVHLVGAGPGDPELLTVKALRLIQSADVVVYDRLVSPEILQLIPSGVTRISVGKAAGKHSLPQDEINELLAGLATGGRKIVRLKGGDPYIFGRGGEEAAYLVQHGVPFEVVPGITAACACASYAGIPLTHRGLSHGVRFVAGHCRADEPLDLDWRGLADPDTTLVVYMGAAKLEEIRSRLIRSGLPADTPAAAIENGTTPRQRRCVATLATLPDQIRKAGFQAPVIIVIGKVVSLADDLNWFEPETTEPASELKQTSYA